MMDDTLINKLMWYGIDLLKQILFSFINSKIFNKKNQEIVNANSTAMVVKKRSKKFRVMKNLILVTIFKSLIWNRVKAKIMLKPDSKDFSWILDYPLKRYFVNLNDFISISKKNAKVLDLGSGSGFFPVKMAKHLTNGGKVTCIDINYESLKKLQNISKSEKVKNIEFHRAKIEKLPFENECFDSVFLNMTFGQIHDKPQALSEIKRVLKKGGNVYITELLIDNYYCLLSNVLALAIRAGFTPVGEKGNFINYALILKKD